MKISLDEVEDAIMQANIGEKANIIIDDLKARIKELEEEREAKKAADADKPKMQYVGIAAADTLRSDTDGMGWIIKVPEDFELGTLKETIKGVIAQYNNTKRKGKNIQSLSDAFQTIKAKLWKERNIKIITKEAVYFSDKSGIIEI